MARKKNILFIYSLIFLLMFSGFSSMGMAAEGDAAGEPEVYLDFDGESEEILTVIVELDEASIIEAKQEGEVQTEENLEEVRQEIIAELEEAADVTVNREYDYLFSGFSVEISQADLPELFEIEGVKAVYPNQTYEVSQIEEAELLDPESFSPMMMDSAPFIGADEAWDAGYTGEGVTVAIIDTGVDYTHPDLAHAFGDYLGWDFVSNDADPQETNTGNMSQRTNHGTHVAGTVAANGQIKGVAPDATLLAYRVLGPGGSGTTQNVIAGIERAVQDGADIMNLSLGANVNDPDYATSIALDRAMTEGVVAVTSNGNSGPNNWTVGSPGTSREAISVGATQLPYNLFGVDISTGGDTSYPSAAIMGYPSEEELLALNEGEFEFIDVGLAGTEADFAGKNLEGKIALMRRGDYAFVDKAQNAKDHGAIGAVIYNNVAGVQPQVPGTAIPMIMLTQEDGQKILAELASGNNTISFDIDFEQQVGETIANFSSKGPVMNTWMIKPDVSAPGVAIVSTVPTHNPANPHGYASFQGTSMSAPHVAGAAALILEAHPDWSVDFVKAALMNTAENMYDENRNLYPHNSQGAGSIRVLDAINTEVLATPGSHSFGIFTNEEDKEVRRQFFTVQNLSHERKRFSIEFTGHEGIKVMHSNNLQVQPGKTQNLNFGVQVDVANLDPGYYEGTFILSDGTSTIEVPTIVFVGEPDYPLLSGLQLSMLFNFLIGSVNVPHGADEFVVRFKNTSTGEVVAETARATNVAPGTRSFTYNTNQLPRGSFLITVYAKKGDREFELEGGVLTRNQ
ncbi:S8 family serine peptidase [Evansella clarkii]|uniref:S8 family serine peptidase n=1 Tax=Evansella clarkii TaxID=79879 RepID=UPI000B43CF41|nr:S8 family serine peptidase [Evansella clarkii]